MAKRKHDRWPELCDRVAEEDNLPCREAGAWTEEKLFTWNRYLEITSNAMATNPKWSGLVYVDLFGGPGICKLKETKKRFPGSALLAAYAPKAFHSILVCEKNVTLAEALKTRLERAASGRGHVIVGDCNEKIGELVSKIPDRALTLAFIDPEGLHIHFETLRILTANRQIDVAILLADGMDIVRNVDVYEKQAESNIDRFFGPNSGWRIEWRNLPNQNPENTCQLFGNLYKKQLEKLGFSEFNDKAFKSGAKAIYRIIYASKHPLGARFWNEISKIDRDGQKSFDF
jgi:three-Cys-motif partner protein